jgi:methylthioribose-1-phosphate isomerase
MKIDGTNFTTIWLHPSNPAMVQIIDQRALPHRFEVMNLRGWQDGVRAITDMAVRGAPLIGATAAWSLYLAAREAVRDNSGRQLLQQAAQQLVAARPTAVNLEWAVGRVMSVLEKTDDPWQWITLAQQEAEAICVEDIDICRRIGENGVALIEEISARKEGEPVNILTHCNAGWLATVDWGTALAPIYVAQERGIPMHIWVDETRPRNQGSQLTAWELAQQGIPHSVIVDSAGGHLMQSGEVDLVITGTDRTTRTGDVANKIGTYLKALAAHDNEIPFYVALPSTTIDWNIGDGIGAIPIEERDPDEIIFVQGLDGDELRTVRTLNEASQAKNYAFDVTPSRLVTGLITERGVCPASEDGLARLFPERTSEPESVDEGYIKFDCEFTPAPPPDEALLAGIDLTREKMFRIGLIGHDEEHEVDFGNLSIRGPGPGQIIITGTQTGHFSWLGADHYVLVTEYDIEANLVRCTGTVRASSETLTHAAIYELDPGICAVVHVHHLQLWEQWKNVLPTTAPDVAYGTPEMARELARLYQDSELRDKRLAVMGGHPGGLISFGETPAAAEGPLLALL